MFDVDRIEVMTGGVTDLRLTPIVQEIVRRSIENYVSERLVNHHFRNMAVAALIRATEGDAEGNRT